MIVVLFSLSIWAQESEPENAKVEFLKPIEISNEKRNEYTGRYLIESEGEAYISVELNDNDQLAIIIPSGVGSEDGYETTIQYTIIPQYEDKFFLHKDAFVKVHFTRSKRSNKILSVLFNANKVEGTTVIRATKVEE